MSISTEIVDSYKNARPVIARKLAQGPREDRALALVMGASGLFFVASIPGNLRAAAINPDVPLEARLSGALLALLFIAPLIFYVLAGITGLILRLFGGPKGLALRTSIAPEGLISGTYCPFPNFSADSARTVNGLI